jgi:hypothetical protein
VIRNEPEVDITDAAVWYEERQRGLGYAFLAVVEGAIRAAGENPYRYPPARP